MYRHANFGILNYSAFEILTWASTYILSASVLKLQHLSRFPKQLGLLANHMCLSVCLCVPSLKYRHQSTHWPIFVKLSMKFMSLVKCYFINVNLCNGWNNNVMQCMALKFCSIIKDLKSIPPLLTYGINKTVNNSREPARVFVCWRCVMNDYLFTIFRLVTNKS
jgi:hypothetical protein